MSEEISEEVSIGNLLNGGVLDTVDKKLREALADIHNRPGVKAAREVVLKVKIEPEKDEETAMIYPKFSPSVSAKTPPIECMTQQGTIMRDGKCLLGLHTKENQTDLEKYAADPEGKIAPFNK